VALEADESPDAHGRQSAHQGADGRKNTQMLHHRRQQRCEGPQDDVLAVS